MRRKKTEEGVHLTSAEDRKTAKQKLLESIESEQKQTGVFRLPPKKADMTRVIDCGTAGEGNTMVTKTRKTRKTHTKRWRRKLTRP